MQLVVAPRAPSSQKKLKLVGIFAVIFGLGGGFAWASFTPLDSAVVAMGRVTVQSSLKAVQHLEGGIVELIHVTEGESVSANQLLVTLDDTFANTELKRLSSQLQELRIREGVLVAQRDGMEIPVFHPETKALASDPWVGAQIKSALNGFSISQQNLTSQLGILNSQLRQLDEQSLGVKSELKAKAEQLAFVEEEVVSWKALVEKKMANKIRFLEMQNLAAELRGERAQLETKLSGFKSKKGQLKLEKLRVLQAYREKASESLSSVKINIEDISTRLGSAKNILGRVEIRSPVDGVVVGLRVHTLGAVVKPGETVMEVVPEKDNLIVEAKVAPMDIDKIYPGQESRIKISSYKSHEFPEFDGVVESVSADAFDNPETFESFYLARIQIPDSKAALFELDKLKPGMPSEVLIKTGESTPMQYLMEPMLSAFRTAWRDQ